MVCLYAYCLSLLRARACVRVAGCARAPRRPGRAAPRVECVCGVGLSHVVVAVAVCGRRRPRARRGRLCAARPRGCCEEVRDGSGPAGWVGRTPARRAPAARARTHGRAAGQGETGAGMGRWPRRRAPRDARNRRLCLGARAREDAAGMRAPRPQPTPRASDASRAPARVHPAGARSAARPQRAATPAPYDACPLAQRHPPG